MFLIVIELLKFSAGAEVSSLQGERNGLANLRSFVEKGGEFFLILNLTDLRRNSAI